MRNKVEMIAYALEMEPQLLPFAPALLADLDELGSNMEMIVAILQSLKLPLSTRVLDLGCGKGAVAIAIAQELGWHVVGVDLFPPFIEHCRTQAEAAGVAHLCSFVEGNILQLAHNIEPHDVVHIGALGDTLGSCEETVRVVRQYVRPGGYIVISDGYLKDGCAGSFAGFENYASHNETVRRLTSHGDVLLNEFPEPNEESDDEEEESDLILRRAKMLAQQHPHLADAFLAYAADQRSEYEFLRRSFASTIWLLQRT